MDFRPQRFEILPPVVKNLLMVNGIVFLATIILAKQGIDLSNYLALHHWASEKFRVWQLLTHMFMHGNVGGLNPRYDMSFMHLFSNMFALWMFGSMLETYHGGQRFLFFYIVSGIGASIFYLAVLNYQLGDYRELIQLFNSHISYDEYTTYLNKHFYIKGSQLYSIVHDIQDQWSKHKSPGVEFTNSVADGLRGFLNLQQEIPIVGASGAVFAVLFAFAYQFPDIEFFVMPFPFPIKVKYMVTVYALGELITGIMNSAGDHVAHFAHLGGIVVAFLIIKTWNLSNRISR